MLRMLEMIIPESDLMDLKEVLKDQRPLNLWVQPLTEIWIYPEGDDAAELVENSIMVKLLLHEENTEKLLDMLEQKFSQSKGFRIKSDIASHISSVASSTGSSSGKRS